MKIIIDIGDNFPKDYLCENYFDLKEALTKLAIRKTFDEGRVIITLKKEKGSKLIKQKLVNGEYEEKRVEGQYEYTAFCRFTEKGNVVIDLDCSFLSEDMLKGRKE